MPILLFYIFAIIMLLGGVGVVIMKNPVASAFSMIISFVGLAALFVGLNAYFIGILQILVYTGAVMVLFLFIIMLLDIKKEEKSEFKLSTVATGIIIPLLLVLQIIAVFQTSNLNDFKAITPETLAASEQNIPTPETVTDAQKSSHTLVLAETSGIRKSMAAKNPEDRSLPDVNLIGQRLFTEYNFPLQIIGVLLLVATVGCVSLSKKLKTKS